MEQGESEDPRPDAAWFGFRRVAAVDKGGLVRQVFDSVADRYDLMNDLMSGGVHRLWKAALVDWLAPRGDLALVDVAGGTGDVARRVLERAPRARIVVADMNQRMLEVGRDRALDRGILAGLEYVVTDAQALALPDRTFDAYTIAFGLRNVTHIERALAEARRVLKPGGRFLCLEFSRVVVPGLAQLYDAYSFRVLPALGARVASAWPILMKLGPSSRAARLSRSPARRPSRLRPANQRAAPSHAGTSPTSTSGPITS